MRGELTMPRLIVAGALVLGATSGGVAFAQSSGSTLSPEAQQAMDRGRDAAKRQEWKLAIEHFGQARKAAPMSPHALFNLALANDEAGRREHLAIAWYRAYLASAPDATNAGQVRDRIAKLEVQLEANARDLIRKAKEINSTWGLVVDKLSRTLAYMGDFAGAKETAARVEGHMSETYLAIAEAQADAGDMAGAKETASLVTFSWYKPGAYNIILRVQAEAGDIAGARKTAGQAMESIARFSDKDFGGAIKKSKYRIFTKTQAGVGDFAGARANAARIPREDYRAAAYKGIAEAQAEAGDIAGAKATAALITDEEKSWVYEDIAIAQAKVGDIAGARKTAEMITDAPIRERTYKEIAKTKPHVGDEVEDWTGLALSGFIIGLYNSWADDYQRFVEMLKNQEDNDDIAYYLADAAGDMAKALGKLRNMEAKWQQRRAGAAR